jgi:hypothetical protein
LVIVSFAVEPLGSIVLPLQTSGKLVASATLAGAEAVVDGDPTVVTLCDVVVAGDAPFDALLLPPQQLSATDKSATPKVVVLTRRG